jgi:hypothetical protein
MYTGTAIQPDVLTIFVKKEKDEPPCMQYTQPTANVMGKCVPIVGSVIGIARIVNAVKAIFRSIYHWKEVPKGALLNAFRNLVRGMIELIPGSGLYLIMFDTLRNHFVFSSNIEKQVANQQNIAGIAMDGRVMCTIDLAAVQNLKKQMRKPVAEGEDVDFLRLTTLHLLKKEEEEDDVVKMPVIFEAIKSGFEKYRPRLEHGV